MDQLANSFSQQVIAWQVLHGRQDLPWQKQRTAYRVWLSEIMLQQTQVATVVPYFKRFIKQFPSIKSLAQADEDLVLSLWSGLGYYSRARNLHRCAQIIVDQYKGRFPKNIQALEKLPGIGRSTAGAIMALAFEQPCSILDGNVKRVLSRFFAIEGWYGESQVQKQLWQLSDSLVPDDKIIAYTQGMMDLGAMICTRTKPACNRCPLQSDCQAFAQQRTTELPTPKPKKKLPTRQKYFLLISNAEDKILLEKRPPVGIWGGLWSLLECEISVDIKTYCKTNLGLTVQAMTFGETFTHIFSHFRLTIAPVFIQAKSLGDSVLQPGNQSWYTIGQALELGLATPVKKLLSSRVE